jgi:glycosyltransferase involved in cell wall biosynthesis
MKNFDKYFIYVGNAYPHKNLERLIKAMVLLNKVVKDHIGLAIVSSRNVFTQRLEKLIRKLKAEEYIHLLGFVPDEDLEKLNRGSVAFVFASISEGFGLPGLEAMASGTLVLASDIPVFKEVYKENVIYFNPFDVNMIKEAMEKALKINIEQREKLILKSQTFAKRYSWSKMAQETINLYESCAGLRSG